MKNAMVIPKQGQNMGGIVTTAEYNRWFQDYGWTESSQACPKPIHARSILSRLAKCFILSIFSLSHLQLLNLLFVKCIIHTIPSKHLFNLARLSHVIICRWGSSSTIATVSRWCRGFLSLT